MMMPCSVCGTIIRVKPNSEIIYCTTCGTQIELGTHSNRTEGDSQPRIFCVNCSQRLDTTIPGYIFSCNNCSENICNICAKLFDGKHYCPNCHLQLQKIKASTKLTAKKPTPKKAKKPKRKSKPKATAKQKTKQKTKQQAKKKPNSKSKSIQKSKSKQKSKSSSSKSRKSRSKKKK